MNGGFARRAWAEKRARDRDDMKPRIERAKNVDLVALARRHGVAKLEKRGAEWAGLCPFHQEKSPSFTIVPGKRMFHCFGCGWHGDAIKFEQVVTGVTFVDAVKALTGDAVKIPRSRGVAVPLTLPSPSRGEGDDFVDADRVRDQRRAFEIWKSCARCGTNSPVETYLRARGIDVARIGGVPPSLRYHPALMHWGVRLEFPCMVALLQGCDSAPTGVHRTYLAADARKKAELSAPKMILGGAAGSTIRFTVARPWLVIGEGIETTLSAMDAHGIEWSDSRIAGVPGFWCAVSLGNMAGRGKGRGDPHPDPSKADPRGNRRRLPARTPDMDAPALRLPDNVRRVTILRDRDGSDPLVTDALVARAVNRWRAEGRRVEVASPPAGMDFNEWWVSLQKGGAS